MFFYWTRLMESKVFLIIQIHCAAIKNWIKHEEEEEELKKYISTIILFGQVSVIILKCHRGKLLNAFTKI